MLNVFFCGLSGSGKDTLANYFRDTHGYLKFRLAGTIKQIITEKGHFSFSQIDELKRTNENIRKDHWIVGDWMGADGNAVMQRIKNICDRDSVEFDMLPADLRGNPICICDVRRDFEIRMLLERGFVGVFLTRTTEELKENQHSTEINMFKNGLVKNAVEKFPGQCLLVYNNGESPEDVLALAKDKKEMLEKTISVITFNCNPNAETLINVFKPGNGNTAADKILEW